MKPKISVIMAVHNEPCKVLEESIRSILTQTYKNFELIICDDCSEKETLEFLKGVLLWDDRIKLLRNTQNLFAAATRNKGILASQGEYIAIADADDFSYPDRLQKEKDFLDNHPEYAFVSSKAVSYTHLDVYKRQGTVIGIIFILLEGTEKKKLVGIK